MGGYINSEMVKRNNIVEKIVIEPYLIKEVSNMILESTKENLFNN